MAIIIGPCWTNFCSQKLKRRILATFFITEATLGVLRPVFEDHIISSRADVVWPPRSCDLTPLHYYLWGAVKDKCYADKPETIDALKDNIREAIGEIQLHTVGNLLKNGIDRVGHCIIALLAAELMSFDHLEGANWHFWTIICRVSSKVSVMPTSQRQLTL